MNKKAKKTGAFIGVPYDWRRPTVQRLRSRMWNPDAPFITPKSFGWGFDFNWYVLFHPRRSSRNKSTKTSE